MLFAYYFFAIQYPGEGSWLACRTLFATWVFPLREAESPEGSEWSDVICLVSSDKHWLVKSRLGGSEGGGEAT